VLEIVALSIQLLAPISTSSSIITFPICGINNIKNPIIYKSEIPEIQKGDIILEVNGKPFNGWFFLQRENEKKDIQLKILRNNDTINLTLKKNNVFKLSPKIEPIIDNVIKDYPAYQAGLRKGDKIIEIDGEKIEDWSEISNVLSKKANKEIKLKYERNGKIYEVQIKVKSDFVEKNKVE